MKKIHIFFTWILYNISKTPRLQQHTYCIALKQNDNLFPNAIHTLLIPLWDDQFNEIPVFRIRRKPEWHKNQRLRCHSCECRNPLIFLICAICHTPVRTARDVPLQVPTGICEKITHSRSSTYHIFYLFEINPPVSVKYGFPVTIKDKEGEGSGCAI